jgi:RNA polymerase-binding transcription factor DksA
MATKKKTAKAAKKASPVKRSLPAKKVSAKPAKHSGSKSAKPAAKKSVQVIAKKEAAKKATHPGQKASRPSSSKPISKPLPAAKSIKKEDVKKSAAVKSDKKNDIKKPEVRKVEATKPAEVKKVEMKKPEAVAPPPPPPPAKKPAPPAKPLKVVIPDMKTKTSRRYEPEFTKSVLDQPEHINMGPTMRYSDNELVEFRELIQKKLDQAKKELAYLQGLITRKDEMGGDETENRYMTMEDGSMSMEREQLAQMASRQINYIDHLEKAMMRIENKTYGICRVTGKLIDKARLRAVPHATLSIEAKQTMNR